MAKTEVKRSNNTKRRNVKKLNLKDELGEDKDYRRGYHQGYFQALTDVNRFYNKQTRILDIFLDTELTRWRYELSDEGKIKNPPEFKYSKNSKGKLLIGLDQEHG